MAADRFGSLTDEELEREHEHLVGIGRRALRRELDLLVAALDSGDLEHARQVMDEVIELATVAGLVRVPPTAGGTFAMTANCAWGLGGWDGTPTTTT